MNVWPQLPTTYKGLQLFVIPFRIEQTLNLASPPTALARMFSAITWIILSCLGYSYESDQS